MDFGELTGMKASHMFSGALGAIVGYLVFPRNRYKLFELGITILAGLSCAAYFTTPVVEYMNKPPSWEGGTGFIIGILGLTLVKTILRLGPLIIGRIDPSKFASIFTSPKPKKTDEEQEVSKS